MLRLRRGLRLCRFRSESLRTPDPPTDEPATHRVDVVEEGAPHLRSQPVQAMAVGTPALRGSMVVGTPKTHERRSVPYPEFLSLPISAACAGKAPDDLVFDDGYGGYQKTPTMTKNSWWDRALARADLRPMTIHDLRHTAASLAVSAGANVKAVQRMLGHASAAMTLDTYSDLFDADLDALAERLHQAASPSSGAIWAPR